MYQSTVRECTACGKGHSGALSGRADIGIEACAEPSGQRGRRTVKRGFGRHFRATVISWKCDDAVMARPWSPSGRGDRRAIWIAIVYDS
jgi:hypothetical protein